jgi:Tol biopolymer transport system component
VTRAIACGFALAASAAAQSTSIVSYDASGQLHNEDAYRPWISADGRYVAFQWYDNFSKADLFLRDLATGVFERVSVNSNEVSGNGYSYVPTLTPDVRYVAFSSYATNLVPGDTNGPYPVGHDVFVRDRVNGTTERVSIGSLGQQGNDQSYHPAISADGRYVAFTSYASNLVAADSNGFEDVFVRDRVSGTTELVSLDPSGAQSNGGTACASMSADGRFVVLYGLADNLVAGDTNAVEDVFVRDRLTATTERVSVDASGAEGNASSYGVSITPDGRYVTFQSYATNLVSGDTNGTVDAFVRDRQTGATERLSVDSSGMQGNGDSSVPRLTPDGRFAVFQSASTNLVAGDTNGRRDIFLRDRLLGTTQLVSVDSNGLQGNADSGIQGPSISSDARYIAFDSRAQFVATDMDNWHDIYVRDRGAPAPSEYCTSGTSSIGCSATIAASASPSVSLANACNVTVSNVDGQKSGLLFYGIDNTSFVPGPWASGSTSFLCVKPPAQRTAIQSSGGTTNACDGSYTLDWNAYQSANPLALGNPWSAGDRLYVQAWFRDPPAPKSTNLSNSIELVYLP